MTLIRGISCVLLEFVGAIPLPILNSVGARLFHLALGDESRLRSRSIASELHAPTSFGMDLTALDSLSVVGTHTGGQNRNAARTAASSLCASLLR